MIIYNNSLLHESHEIFLVYIQYAGAAEPVWLVRLWPEHF